MRKKKNSDESQVNALFVFQGPTNEKDPTSTNSIGRVVEYTLKNDIKYIQYTAFTHSKSEGSLVIDAQFKPIALHLGIMKKKINHGVLLRQPAIKKGLEEFVKKIYEKNTVIKTIEPSTTKLGWKLNDGPQGPFVVNVQKDSIASQNNIKPSWSIAEVNGTGTKNMTVAQVRRLIQATSRHGKETVIKFFVPEETEEDEDY